MDFGLSVVSTGVDSIQSAYALGTPTDHGIYRNSVEKRLRGGTPLLGMTMARYQLSEWIARGNIHEFAERYEGVNRIQLVGCGQTRGFGPSDFPGDRTTTGDHSRQDVSHGCEWICPTLVTQWSDNGRDKM